MELSFQFLPQQFVLQELLYISLSLRVVEKSVRLFGAVFGKATESCTCSRGMAER